MNVANLPALFTKMSMVFSVHNISLAHFLTDAKKDNSKCLKTNSPTSFSSSVFFLILSIASCVLDALLHAIITRAPWTKYIVWSNSIQHTHRTYVLKIYYISTNMYQDTVAYLSNSTPVLFTIFFTYLITKSCSLKESQTKGFIIIQSRNWKLIWGVEGKVVS